MHFDWRTSARMTRSFLTDQEAGADHSMRAMVDRLRRSKVLRAVETLGWYRRGCLRHRTLVKPANTSDTSGAWLPCRTLHELAVAAPRDWRPLDTVRAKSCGCRVVVHAKPPKGRNRLPHGLIRWPGQHENVGTPQPPFPPLVFQRDDRLWLAGACEVDFRAPYSVSRIMRQQVQFSIFRRNSLDYLHTQRFDS